MSHSYPIWNTVTREPHYAGRMSFGAHESFKQTVRVGTSATNRHVLGDITVQRIEQADGTVEFALYLDNTMLRRGILDGKQFTREDITEL